MDRGRRFGFRGGLGACGNQECMVARIRAKA
jgi:hypothetical protein